MSRFRKLPLNDLGHALRVRRVEQRLRLFDVADRSGLSESFLSRVENADRTPSDEDLAKICRVLDTSPAELLRRTNGARG
jgi:transcriptional regulator with XRE-family HTH domain